MLICYLLLSTKGTVMSKTGICSGEMRWMVFLVSGRPSRYPSQRLGKIGRKSWLARPELRTIVWMLNLGENFSNPGEQVVRLSSDTSATAQMCLELQWNCRLVGCKVDAKCLPASTEELTVTYTTKLLNENSENSGTCKVLNESKTAV